MVNKGKQAAARPKIEMSSMVRGHHGHSKRAASAGEQNEQERLDLLAVYANRNKKLDAELGRMQAQLEDATRALRVMEQVHF